MPIPKMMNPQNDFSAGQLNEDAKRSDDPLVRAGARQLINWRILNSRKVVNRPGRTALFPTDGRVDDVQVAPGVVFRLCFGNGSLKIRDGNGIYSAGNTGYAWTALTAKNIVWEVINRDALDRDVVMCFPGQRPKIARWSAAAGWSFLDFSFTTNAYGAYLEPFYRLAAPGLSITPSAITGSVTVAASAPYFVAAMVGTVVRWIEHQILLTAFTDTQTMTGIVIEQLPVTVSLGTIGALKGVFNVGDAISSTTAASSTFEGEVAAVTITTGVVTSMKVNMFTSGEQFATSDQITGPQGTCTAGSVTVVSPGASTQWDEEAMSQYRGWPNSCFFDQDRLGFCDMPSVPGGIVWSRIGVYSDFLVGANADDPMFEIVPNRARVYHVVNKSDEFVMTDKGIWYIPISASNPLKPGSVQFLQVSNDPVSSLRPTLTTQAIIYLNGSLNRVGAILPKMGSLYIPWSTEETSLYHSNLFNNPIAIAATTATGDFQEQYVHVLNSDGTMAVGKFDVGKEWAGWLPWNGQGLITWLSSLGQNLILTTTYISNAVPVMIAESVDDGQYVDAAIGVNIIPPSMVAGNDPTIPTLLVGGTFTNDMINGAAPAASVDGNFLKNLAQSVTITSATNGYGNRVWQLVTGGPLKLSRARVTAPLDSPLSGAGSTSFRIIGSHDGATWVTVFTYPATLGANGEQIDITAGIDQTTAYEYYGVDIFGVSGDAASVCQMEFFWLAPGEVHKSPSGGTGVLWWLAGGTADLIDGVMSKGTYQIDGTGAILPVENGEVLTSPTLMAGRAWIATLEPYIALAQAGQDEEQRMRRRKIVRAAVSVQNSTGYVFCGRRVPPYNAGDDQTQQPPLREGTNTFRPHGRSYDPRQALVKDMPGPITVLEMGYEMAG